MEITRSDCAEQSPSDKYRILSKTWSTDKLIDTPTIRVRGGETSFKEGREVDNENQADFSALSVLSFLAAGTDDEGQAGNISDAVTVA